MSFCYDEIEDDIDGIDARWCLVKRFLVDKKINFKTIQHMLASLWKPGTRNVGQRNYVLQFYHEVYTTRVIEGSPWTFDRMHVVFLRLKQGEIHVRLFLIY